MYNANLIIPSYMSKSNVIILALIALIIVMAFWGVENKQASEDARIEKEQVKDSLQHEADSLQEVIKEFQAADLRALQVIQEATIRADRAEAAAQKAISNYEKIRITRSTTDLQRDSILADILSN